MVLINTVSFKYKQLTKINDILYAGPTVIDSNNNVLTVYFIHSDVGKYILVWKNQVMSLDKPSNDGPPLDKSSNDGPPLDNSFKTYKAISNITNLDDFIYEYTVDISYVANDMLIMIHKNIVYENIKIVDTHICESIIFETVKKTKKIVKDIMKRQLNDTFISNNKEFIVKKSDFGIFGYRTYIFRDENNSSDIIYESIVLNSDDNDIIFLKANNPSRPYIGIKFNYIEKSIEYINT